LSFVVVSAVALLQKVEASAMADGKTAAKAQGYAR
jgi:hypothetical protein